mgnify:CR=1 FL=1
MKSILVLALLLTLTSCLKTAEQVRREQRVDTMSQQLSDSQNIVADLTVMFATVNGYVRRNALSDFGDVRANGKIAMNLPEGVSLSDAVRVTNDTMARIGVPTTIYGSFQGTARAFQASLDKLGLEYLDLYLIHWPDEQNGKYIDAWGGIMKSKEVGHTRSIGVSNFTPEHLSNIIDLSFFTPAVNQIEMHPRFQHLTHGDLRHGVSLSEREPALAGLGFRGWLRTGSNPRILDELPPRGCNRAA